MHTGWDVSQALPSESLTYFWSKHLLQIVFYFDLKTLRDGESIHIQVLSKHLRLTVPFPNGFYYPRFYSSKIGLLLKDLSVLLSPRCGPKHSLSARYFPELSWHLSLRFSSGHSHFSSGRPRKCYRNMVASRLGQTPIEEQLAIIQTTSESGRRKGRGWQGNALLPSLTVWQGLGEQSKLNYIPVW